MKKLDLALLPSDKTILDELGESHPEVKKQYLLHIESLNKRRTTLLAEAEKRKIGAQEPLLLGPDEELLKIQRSLETQAVTFDNAAKGENRKQLLARHAELTGRSKLKDLLPLVIKAIDSYSLIAKLSNALKQTNTNGITRKSSELTDAAIASGLNASLDRELKGLGVTGLKLGIDLHGQKGQGRQQLRLDMARPNMRAKASQILSEGEQRAISIACFLAETNLVSQTTSMVFDDPVSSVDHIRRGLIANRLAAEARNRQVIVFTHDLSFAWDLTEAAKSLGIPYHGRRVYPAGLHKGIIAEGLPHESGKISGRINTLIELATRVKKTLEVEKKPEEYEQLVRNGYRKLRDLWERLIEEALFGDVVRRFGNSINTRELRKVEVEDQDYAQIDKGMTECSKYTHDGPTEAPPPLPQPDGFRADIEFFKTTYERIAARTKVTEKRRGTP